MYEIWIAKEDEIYEFNGDAETMEAVLAAIAFFLDEDDIFHIKIKKVKETE